ncbi:MAG TPA: hypothetical protein VF316_03630 [Polyangiaceae bacterium]
MVGCLLSHDRRITVTRGVDQWELVIKYDGRYRPATRLDPEEWPDPYIAFAWFNGCPMADPMDVPEDVILEAVAIDADYEPDEPDPPEDDDHSFREEDTP